MGLLEELVKYRDELAQEAFEKAKTEARQSDVHFASFFYSSIHFGLPSRNRLALKDGSRMNYGALQLVNIANIQTELWQKYTVPALVQKVRFLLETDNHWMRKALDFLKTVKLPGLTEDQWLYKWVHDDEVMNPKLRDEAIVLM